MALLAFDLLRMEAATSAGERVDEHFGAEYREVRERARSLAGGGDRGADQRELRRALGRRAGRPPRPPALWP